MKKTLSLVLAVTMMMAMMITGTALAEEYVYGTAVLTWEQFWTGEEITYNADIDFAAVNENTDTEGMTDLGGYDAVSRATSKHGVYRGAQNFAYALNAADADGNTVTISLTDLVDVVDLEDAYGAGKNFYAVADGENTVYTLAEPTEGEYITYTISDFQVVGFKAWPVKVLASEAEAAAAAVNFVVDETVTEETGRLKTVSVDAEGNVTVSAMTEATGIAVNYTGAVSQSYNDNYGDYIFVQMSDCEPDWAMNLLGAKYTFYGETDPTENADAEPVAVYGTKYGADVWWKSNGKLLQFGINNSYRHGGSGEAVGTEQNGWWGITVMCAGYEDYTIYVQTKPAYEDKIEASLADGNATLTIAGVEETDWANTTVLVDGVEVTGFENGVAALDSVLSVGEHKITVTVDTYRDNSASVTAMSTLTMADITMEGNVLTVANDELEIYLANITGIAVNGTTLNGNNLGATVFNEDGSVNFEAVISDRRGETIVFADGNKVVYELMITSAGYPAVMLSTVAAE